MAEKIRVGIIGAGGYTVSRMLPGFAKVEDCEVTTVANRNRANAEKVAAQFGIPTVLDSWQQVIESAEVDAILIGTPPNLHKAFQHIGILSLEFHVDKLSRPLL